MHLDFWVAGIPQPQGSARAFIPKGWARAVITTDNKSLKPWRQEVAIMARVEMAAKESVIIDNAPVSVACEFRFVRPKSLNRRVVHKTTKPDIDKLLRGILDALTGIVFHDDSQVVYVVCTKSFSDAPGCKITVADVAAIHKGDEARGQLELL